MGVTRLARVLLAGWPAVAGVGVVRSLVAGRTRGLCPLAVYRPEGRLPSSISGRRLPPPPARAPRSRPARAEQPARAMAGKLLPSDKDTLKVAPAAGWPMEALLEF